MAENGEIRDEYLSGDSMAAIGKRRGISSMTVLFRLRRMGIKTRPRGEFKRIMSKDIREAVIECWKKHDGKITGIEIAREIGCCDSTAQKYLREEAKRLVHPS
jgi:hypothetical protein